MLPRESSPTPKKDVFISIVCLSSTIFRLLLSWFKEVFAFFLSQINKRFKEAKYGLVQVEVGEDFDAVNQVDLSQNSRGRVSECVFYGYGFLKEKEDSNEEDVVIRIIKSPLVLTA